MKKTRFFAVLAIMLVLCVVAPAAASAATVEMAYGGGSIYLRTGPGRGYSNNGTVKDGETITILSYGDVWSRIRTANGRTGYIKNLYINDGDNYYASGTSYFSSRYSIYTTAGVNMRAGASTNTSVLRTLAKGTKLTAMGKNNGFYLVQTADGTQGYVSGSYLTRNYVSSGSASTSGGSSVTRMVTASYVNMRAGGGMSYSVLRVLPYGSHVTEIYRGNYWTRVNYNGTIGWIKNTYLR